MTVWQIGKKNINTNVFSCEAVYRVRKTQLQVRETFSIKSLNGLNKMTCQVIIMYGTLTFCCTVAPLIISHHIFVNVWRQRRRQCHNRPKINHIDTSDIAVCVWPYSTNNTSEIIVSQLLGSCYRPYVWYTHFLKAIHPWVSLLFCKYQIVSEQNKITFIYSLMGDKAAS